jgi:hypothetical protein
MNIASELRQIVIAYRRTLTASFKNTATLAKSHAKNNHQQAKRLFHCNEIYAIKCS